MLLLYIIFPMIGVTISASLKFGKLECLEKGLFSCYLDSSSITNCIDKSNRCDGISDCKSGEDELFCSYVVSICPIHKFYCNLSKICINEIQRCDGVRDCDSGEDELDCPLLNLNKLAPKSTTPTIFQLFETSTEQTAVNKNTENTINEDNIGTQDDKLNNETNYMTKNEQIEKKLDLEDVVTDNKNEKSEVKADDTRIQDDELKNEGLGLVSKLSGIIGGILAVTLVAGLLIFLKLKKAKRKRSDDAARIKLLLSHGFPQILEKDFKFYTTPQGQRVVLGRGNFGVVYKGKISDKDVAIKELLKNSASKSDIFSFNPQELMEANMHNRVGDHENIVRFFAVHISSEKQTFYMFTEFCPGGDLLSFLLKNYTQEQKENIAQVQIAQKDFLTWSTQILAGMAYLEHRNIVHGDLAARNVLLVSKELVKIADFGLALQIRHDKNYIRHFQKIPWQWMPFEVILEVRYTTKSDVWSFGVLLWEMFSFGQMPFKNLDISEGMQLLKTGSRLENPIFTPTEIYNVMESCWRENSEDRPKFEKLLNMIREMSVDFLTKAKTPAYV